MTLILRQRIDYDYAYQASVVLNNKIWPCNGTFDTEYFVVNVPLVIIYVLSRLQIAIALNWHLIQRSLLCQQSPGCLDSENAETLSGS